MSLLDKGKEKRIQAILTCIAPDHRDPTVLRINIDRVGAYLMKEANLKFSMTRFDKDLEQEMRKTVGYPITPELLHRIALYIDDLAIYLTSKQGKIEATRMDEVRSRRQKQLKERKK